MIAYYQPISSFSLFYFILLFIYFWYQVKEFIKELEAIKTKDSISLDNIFNMDETGVWFEMANKTTVTLRGEQVTRAATSGADKQRVTVVLAVSASGKKLPPTLIFKGKEGKALQQRFNSDRDNFPQGVHVYYQSKLMNFSFEHKIQKKKKKKKKRYTHTRSFPLPPSCYLPLSLYLSVCVCVCVCVYSPRKGSSLALSLFFFSLHYFLT